MPIPDQIPEEYRKLVMDTLDTFTNAVGHDKPLEVVAMLFTLIESCAWSAADNIGMDRTVYMIGMLMQRLAKDCKECRVDILKMPKEPTTH